ncbi:MAG: hypothetical protein ACSHW1_21290 [Yoonia sp.]|uniref:hypothetical protein n=1 Tax=Yoonia sp. TaxID=2212373 RepID=UPI003EF13F6B
MIAQLRSIAGWGAITAYLVTGAVIYFRVMPGAAWHWPPDFHFLGYNAQTIAPFLDALSGPARDGYVRVLEVYDRLFIIALAVWLALTGWRGSGLRYVVAGLAVLYAIIDLSENEAILRVLDDGDAFVSAAHHLTMAKFASLYLCILVLIVHVRRSA